MGKDHEWKTLSAAAAGRSGFKCHVTEKSVSVASGTFDYCPFCRADLDGGDGEWTQ